MFSKAFPVLVGALYVLCQVFAQETFVAELTVESNVTLEAVTIMEILNSTSDVTVTDNDGKDHTVTITEAFMIAECLMVGDDSNCNCSEGFTWSNDVCYNEMCCRDTTCYQNVSYYAPLCVPKVQVMFNGSAQIATEWTATESDQLTAEFERLNGLEFLNITVIGTSTADFVGAAAVAPPSYKLEELLMYLKGNLSGEVMLDTLGMVTMTSPDHRVCYLSKPVLTCTFPEESESVSWTLSKPFEFVYLSIGTVVKLDHNCATAEQPSCSTLTLDTVTSTWEGTYSCGFTKGSVTYKAKALLEVAWLPDEIKMSHSPLAAECSGEPSEDVEVTAIIPYSPNPYTTWWDFGGQRQGNLLSTVEGDQHVYKFTVLVPCEKTTEAHFVNITFGNQMDQTKSAHVEIPVLYAGEKFCEAETLDGEFWPKTPYKATVFNRTCPEGRTGYKSRTCDGPRWQDPFYYCVNEQLNNVLGAAENFLKGQGATDDVARDIFSDLKNNSMAFATDSSANTADVDTSINILSTMAVASEKFVLQDDLLPDFVGAASNMLNTTWTGVNQTNLYDMSAGYLEAVETLLENIHINQSKSLKTDNIDLKVCPKGNCNVTVFDIDVSLNRTKGRPRIVALKNLTPKLENNYASMEKTEFLLSATLSFDRPRNGSKSTPVEIYMEFPTYEDVDKQPFCVFWNITTRSWSDEGCVLYDKGPNGSVCHCKHLTSFSVLMSKGDISTAELDIITYVGLGVSVCCLIIFLTIESVVWSAVVKSNLSHFRHTAMVNIGTFRLLADLSFLASVEPKSLSDNMCFALTVAKHLFYVAMFCWMLCLSIMLVHQLIFVFSPLRKRVFMFLSSIVGYVFPILIVGCSYVYYKYTFKPYYDRKTCWLMFVRLLEGSVHAFLIPIGIVIFANIFSMAVVIVTLVKTQTPDSGKADDKETAKSIIKVLVILAPVFGVTWLIGFFLLILDSTNPMFVAANYTFTILNSFQGLFILIAGCVAEQKVREEVIKRITGKSSSDSSKSMTTTTYTKDK